MSLQDWYKNGWLREHRTNRQEIQDLISVVERDLADCQVSGLSADWRLGIAYNAALQMAKAALAAAGYRAARDAHHFRVIESLALTLSMEPEIVTRFDAFRRKRNQAEYDQAGCVSDHEAEEMIELAVQIHQDALRWLRTEHPELA